MSIQAEDLHSWIGAEVVARDGEKLGKVGEVYYRDGEALIVEVRSGLGGRKHHVASLRDARVSKDHLRLAAGELTALSGSLDGDTLAALGAQDPRLRDVAPDEVEGHGARQERDRVAAEAAARAEALEGEAAKHREAEEKAAAKADDASSEAHAAREAREKAEAEAQAARKDASR